MALLFDQIPTAAPPPPPNFDALPDQSAGQKPNVQVTPTAQWPPPSVMQSILRGAESGLTAGFAPQVTGALASSGLESELPYLTDEQLAAVQKSGGVAGAYASARDQTRSSLKAAQAANPTAFGVGEFGGAVAPMLLAPEAGTVKEMLAQGAKIGAGYGAASGAAAATEKGGPADVATGAGEGLISGALGGAAGVLLGAGIGKAGNAALDYLGRPIASTIRGWVSPETEAARRVGGALQADYPQVAAGQTPGLTPPEFLSAKIQGTPVMLADLGGETTRALLRSAANTSPEGRALIQNFIQQRFEQQNDRAGTTIRSLIAGGADTAKTSAQLEAEYDAERGGAYGAAYAAGDRPIWSPALERLTNAPSVAGALRGAISNWRDWQVIDGFGGMNPPVRVTPDGQLQFTGGKGILPYPNLQLWDYAARNLAGAARAAARAGNDTEAARLGGLEMRLKSALDTEVPEFRTARGIAAQYFGGNNAIEAGEEALKFKGNIRDLQRTMAQMRPAERAMFQESYADALARKVENMPDTADVTKRLYNSPQERARITAVLGPSAADRIGAFVDRERVFDAARTALGNSTTARQLIEAGLAGGTAGAVLSGGDPKQIAAYGLGAAGARRLAPDAAMAAVRTAVGYVNRNTAREVAKLLTSSNPQDLMRGLQIAAKNQRVGNALRAMGLRTAAAGGIQGTRPLPALQGPSVLNAQEPQQNVPGPPGQ